MILAAASSSSASSAATVQPIQLHLDLELDPAKEKSLTVTYEKTFRPAIRKQPGFVDVRLLKLRSALAGAAPANMAYRLILSFATEEHRKTWVATDLHQKVWPEMEKHLKGAKYTALLYDTV